MSLYEYVRSNPTNFSDPHGLWGYEIHKNMTTRIAKEEGMIGWAAVKLGIADNDVDPPYLAWGLNTTKDTLSWHFDIPHDSKLSWGPSDSRYIHSREKWVSAVLNCRRADREQVTVFKDEYVERAVDDLGRGLHPLQDWVAHGTWDPTYDNALNWRQHPKGSDDPGMDFVEEGNTGIIIRWDGILRDYVRDGISKPDGYKAAPGTRRMTKTENMTKAYLGFFKSKIGKSSYCYCKLYGESNK